MYFSKALVVLSVAVSALASPHMARGVHHRDIAHRAAMPEAAPEPVLVPAKKVKKRGDTSRCKVRSSSSAAPAATTTHVSSSTPSSSPAPTTSSHSSSVIVPPKNVESDPTTSAAPEPTTSAAPEPSTTEKPTTTQKPTTTKKSSTAKPTPTQPSGGSSNDPLGILTGTKSGDGTFYATGLGSCGITNSDSDYIVAVSHELYDNFPDYQGGNPNNNPICGRKIKATYNGKTVIVEATDRCEGCAFNDLDFSPSAFAQLADFSLGRLHGVTWTWV